MLPSYQKLLAPLLLSVILIVIVAIQQLQPNTDFRKLTTASGMWNQQTTQQTAKSNRSEFLVSRNGLCLTKKHVAFLKVHKTGSSSMMNMFYRFAARYHLNLVLPNSTKWNYNYLGYGKTLDPKSVVPLPAGEHFHILCNHVVYNRQAFRLVMPSDTRYIGILRDPMSNFMSAFSYYGGDLIRTLNKSIPFPQTRAVESFLFNPGKYDKTGIVYYIHNKMSFDFGLEEKDFEDEDVISKFISKLDEDFHLVIILEYLEESLVLMKHLLCWEMRDILYLPVNMRLSRQRRGSKKATLNKESVKRLRQYNKADFQLYDFFKRRLFYQISTISFDFHAEVDHFRKVQSDVLVFCSRWIQGNFTIKSSKWNSAFNVSHIDCMEMMRDELTSVKEKITEAIKKYIVWQRAKINT